MTWDCRRPRTEDELLSWWRAALSDPTTPRHDGEPQVGLFVLRMIKGGPWVPVKIWAEQETDEAGELCAPVKFFAIRGEEAVDPESIWTHCRPVSEEQFARIKAFREDNVHRFSDRARIDLSRTPTMP